MGSAAGVVGVWTGAQHDEGTYYYDRTYKYTFEINSHMLSYNVIGDPAGEHLIYRRKLRKLLVLLSIY